MRSYVMAWHEILCHVGWHHQLDGLEFEQAPGDVKDRDAWVLQSMGLQRIGQDRVTEKQPAVKKYFFSLSSNSPVWASGLCSTRSSGTFTSGHPVAPTPQPAGREKRGLRGQGKPVFQASDARHGLHPSASF